MTDRDDKSVNARADAGRGVEEEHELEAEQESAEAMDAEVMDANAVQQPDASRTTEGQPS
jgi:hypothetical protein